MNNKGGMSGLMRQAQRMQKRMLEVQEDLKHLTIEAQVGGGMVIVVANGHQEIVSITIAPEVVDPEDVEMLEDLVQAAVNEARRKSQELAAEEMEKLTGGFNIPGLPGLS
ncbi:MAG: YbaB/EbfC family nucleoid-associated protein [Candidatus Poribacteria bacterium]|nr:YbaB/EbfC family nucleoid-associated protein [Candidatus Poribacteria bacterium]